MAKYQNIYFAISEPTKNIGNVRNYFIENTVSLTTFHFSHGYLDRQSYFEKYKNGERILRKTFPRYTGNNKFIKLILNYIYLYGVLFLYAEQKSFVIVDNPFFCFLSTVPSFFKKSTFIFLIGDYFPEHTGLMWLYNKMADFYNQHSSHVVYLSPPIEEIYTHKLVREYPDNAFRAQISLGIVRKFNTIKKRMLNSHAIKLGFIGVLRQGQGLDLVFRYLQENSHTCTLEVIGEGYALHFYKHLAKQLGISDQVVFRGFIDNPEAIIRTWDIGLALYEDRADNFSRYCEPTKIKEYLSYGLPVITTKATYFNTEIQTYGAGKVIEENVRSLSGAIDTIEREYSAYCRGVENIVNTYAYEQWYDKRFEFLRATL